MEMFTKNAKSLYLANTKKIDFLFGVIQQLRGQNFAIFWPTHPPDVDSFYILSMDKNNCSLTPSPRLPHILST